MSITNYPAMKCDEEGCGRFVAHAGYQNGTDPSVESLRNYCANERWTFDPDRCPKHSGWTEHLTAWQRFLRWFR